MVSIVVVGLDKVSRGMGEEREEGREDLFLSTTGFEEVERGQPTARPNAEIVCLAAEPSLRAVPIAV
jgi:hypothetical protein